MPIKSRPIDPIDYTPASVAELSTGFLKAARDLCPETIGGKCELSTTIDGKTRRVVLTLSTRERIEAELRRRGVKL